MPGIRAQGQITVLEWEEPDDVETGLGAAIAHDDALALALQMEEFMEEDPAGRRDLEESHVADHERRLEVLSVDDATREAVLAGMEDDHDNDWYDSLQDLEAQEEEMMEASRLEGSYQKSPVKSSRSGDGDEGRELSLPELMKKWGAGPSDINPDEPGPSWRRPRTLPLADDDAPKFHCTICMETKLVFDLFHGMRCEHMFCTNCMEEYIELRIRDGNVPIPCPHPDCRAEHGADALHLEECKKSIDYRAFDKWGARLAENALAPDRRTYCPNPQCGILLETTGPDEAPAMGPCPECNCLLCAKCGDFWAVGVGDSGKHECGGGPAARLVKQLASKRQWKQCPNCKTLIEKTAGCRVMHCRCNFIFCYTCGLPFSSGQLEGGKRCGCHDTLWQVETKRRDSGGVFNCE